jgi:hypothetical protein
MLKHNRKTYKKKSYKKKYSKKTTTKKNLKKSRRNLKKKGLNGGNGEEENWPNRSWGTAKEIKDQDEECPICFQSFKNTPNMAIYKTSCNHKMHNDCLLNWHAQGKDTCPICRTEINSNMDDVYSFKNKMLGRITSDFQEIAPSADYFNGKEDVLKIYQEQPDEE